MHHAVIRRNGKQLIDRFSWQVHGGESWWVCGANGSGKSTLLEVLTGQQRLADGEIILPDNISVEKFTSMTAMIRRDFSWYYLFNRSASFYQQRYFSTGVEETPLTIDFIAAETGVSKQVIRTEARELNVEALLGKHIISLSTGEGRRILLLILLLTDKKMICFDDPYAGLDPEGKQLVDNILRALNNKKVTILVTSVETEPPGFFGHVLYVKNQKIAYSGKAQHFKCHDSSSAQTVSKIIIKRHIHDAYDNSFRIAAEMKNITIRYDSKLVQENFSWKISRGEKWMLTGPNGSGKSTLMSLIYGDNPMAYAYELVVFDRPRGTGETIWDIKRPMGYFSSELQQFFPCHMTLYEAVLTGYSDHLAVRRDLSKEQYLQADEIIEAAGITGSRETALSRLSFSLCRLALVCRALVKLPPVVILDEPCQGLDSHATDVVNRLVESVCAGETKTLIYVTHQTENFPRIINRHLDLIKPERG